MKQKLSNNFDKLISLLSENCLKGKKKAVLAVSRQITETYWIVGEQVVVFEQDGKERAEYRSNLMERLSKDLSLFRGKGFSLSDLKIMRQFTSLIQLVRKRRSD